MQRVYWHVRYLQDTRHILETITKNLQMESLMTAQNLPAEDSSDTESDAEEDN